MSTHQEEGWPLGLQPLNVRIVGLERRIRRRRNYLESMSFNTTMLTTSPSSSTVSSSDLDTKSTGSFFHDRSITLGSLLGVSNILELSRRSIRRGRRSTEALKAKKSCKPWIFSLCSGDSIDVKSSTTHNTPSLGQFLAVERRTANNDHSRNPSPTTFGPDGFSLSQTISQPNPLFVDGRIAPPQVSSWSGSEVRSLECANNNGQSVPVLFSCVCGQESR